MTIFAVCSIYDVTAQTYGRPFFAPNRPSAVRSFLSEVQNPESGMLHSHPVDFELWFLGSFDDQSAEFQLVQRERLVRGADVPLK